MVFQGCIVFAQGTNTLTSTGNSKFMDVFIHDYSVGEPIIETIIGSGGQIITQGFLQPILFWSDFVSSSEYKIKLINNYLSPNGDGKNDYLVFEGLENFKVNRLIIVDRSGRMIFSKLNYENNWDGRMNGKDLAEDTYYWILEYGDNNKLKGFVSITHDGQ